MAAERYLNFDSDFFNKCATLDHYLSRGASGNVYGPIQWNDMQLAIKQIMFKDGKVTDKFKKDIAVKQQLWTSLEHEHLTRIHSVDLSQLPKAMFIVMEFAGGGSLYETLRSLGCENKLSIAVVTDWAKQIAEGMLYLHEKNIVHRDLKSSNILLMEPFNICNPHTMMTLKITDFDDVKEHKHTTTMSKLVGTYAYMAPEVLEKQWFSKASDVWCFAVVIWEMLSGDIPYNGLDSTAIMRKSVTGELDLLPLEQSFPDDYKLILKRCWKSTCQERLSFDKIFSVLQRIAKGMDVTEILTEYEVDRLAPNEELKESLRETHIIKSNHQFLVENIKSIRLIDLLREKNCITEEERDHLNKQASSSYRNDALLQWMRTIPFKQEKGQMVLECFRHANQNFVADLLEAGGVVIKSKILTKLVKVGLFTKSSFKNAEGLKEKEAKIIKRLNQLNQGLSLSSIESATSDIADDDIVIVPCCHQEPDGIVIWFWCKSKYGQRNLQRLYESEILLEKLTTIFRQFSNDGASSASKFLVHPTSVTIFVGDLETGIPEKYQTDPVLIGTIRTKAAEEENKSIRGLTIIDKELFVVSGRSSEVEVYDSIELSFSRRWNLKELIDPWDIASCKRNKCLYIFDYKGNHQSKEILIVDPSGQLLKNWSTGDDYGWGLSVTDESNVILTVYSKNKLNEYSPDGRLIREINLSSGAVIGSPLHAVKLPNSHFMISLEGGLHRVCIIDEDGQLKKSYGEKLGSTVEQIDRPVYFSVDVNGFAMVADGNSSQVFLLDSDLKFNRAIFCKDKRKLRNPSRILLDESNGRVLVADNAWTSDGRILIFQLCCE